MTIDVKPVTSTDISYLSYCSCVAMKNITTCVKISSVAYFSANSILLTCVCVFVCL